MESAFACSRPFGGLSSDRSCSRKLWCEYEHNGRRWKLHSRETWVLFQTRIFNFSPLSPTRICKSDGKMLHSIKLVPKASKFKAGKWWENAIRRCHYTCICGPSSREKRRSAQRASKLRKNQNLGQLINVSYHLKNRLRKYFFPIETTLP